MTQHPATEPDAPRFTPRDVWQERQDATEKLSVAQLIKELGNTSVHLRGNAARALAKAG